MVKRVRIYSAPGLRAAGLVFPGVLVEFEKGGFRLVFDPYDLATEEPVWVLKNEEWRVDVLLGPTGESLSVAAIADRRIDTERAFVAIENYGGFEFERELGAVAKEPSVGLE